MKNNNKLILMAVALIVVSAGIGFFGGMFFQKNQSVSNNFAMMGGGNFAMRQGANGERSQQGSQIMQNRGLRPVAGEVISISDNNMVVKLADDSTKIVILSSKTTINKTSQGQMSDLKVGSIIAAFGSENSDGSVTATNVSLNPTMRSVSPESAK